MKKILSLILALTLFALMVISASADTIEELEARQAELEQQAAEYQAQLDQSNAAVNEQQANVDALVGKVETVNEEINISREKISKLDKQIEEKQTLIDQKNQEIEEKMDILRHRVKTIYMSGDVSSLEIILGAKDFSDFLDKLQLVQYVSNHDEELINEIQDELDVINEEKAALQQDKEAQEAEQANLEAKQAELNQLLEENQETLANLQEKSAEARERLTISEENLSALSVELQDAYHEREAAAAAAQSSSGSSGGTPSNAGVSIDVPSNGGFVWPCPGFYYLSSLFYEARSYEYHGGIDIAGGDMMGAIVVAAASGTVVSTCTSCIHNWGKYYSCGCGGGYGNYVWIDHGNGKETIYGHLSSVAVSTGSYVSAGQVIGYAGSTGFSTGTHLHFECRYNGVQYDPMSEY